MRHKFVFHLDPDQVPSLLHHPLLKQYTVATSQEPDISEIYFDTPDCRLHKERIDLSLQTNQQIWIQSLNFRGKENMRHFTGGLLHWCNQAFYLNGPQLDLSLFNPDLLQKSGHASRMNLLEHLNHPVEIFRSRFSQHVFMLHLPNRTRACCVIESGGCSSAGKSTLCCEIGFELCNGDMSDLIDFICMLMPEIPFRVGQFGRVELGYALHRQPAVSAVVAGELSLPPQLAIHEAIERIVETCLIQIQSNQAGIVMDGDVECLHQMRVGLRRLRATFWLCKKIQPFPRELRQELKWLDRKLGSARDWDVFAHTTLHHLKKQLNTNSTDGQAVNLFTTAATNQAQLAHADVTEALSSARYTGLLLGLLRWKYQLPVQANQHHIHLELMAFSNRACRKNQHRLYRFQHDNPELKTGRLHELRIIIKKIRYTTDFFKELYPSKAMQHYILSVTELQELLGKSNDLMVAQRLLQQLLTGNPALHDAGQHIAALLVSDSEHNRPPIQQRLKRVLHTKMGLAASSGRQRL